MNTRIEMLFERVCGPLKKISDRLAVGRCPSCRAEASLFIDLATGDFRCGRLPDALARNAETKADKWLAGRRYPPNETRGGTR
jgi:hypothetical protein